MPFVSARMKLLSLLFCWFNLHDWSDGPGYPCVECGEHDWLYCACPRCADRRTAWFWRR